MRYPFRLASAALALFAPLAFGQRVSFGFVGGTNLTRDFPVSRTLFLDPDYPSGLTTFDLFSEGHRFISGVSVEVALGRALSLEANALHRKLQLKSRFLLPDNTRLERVNKDVSTWEWPILLKYRLPSVGRVRPFFEGGPSFRTRHDPAPSEPSQFGGTVGAGAEFQAGPFRISPALRYTRWQYDGDYPRIATKRDQVELLAGISYATSLPSWNLGGRKLRFGLVGGTPLTKGLNQPSWPERIDELQGYIGGLAAEIELTRRLSLEVNGLYRPIRASEYSENDGLGGARNEFTVLTWQFPVLAKFRLRPEGGLRPTVEAGPSFRLAGNLNAYNPSRFGITAGAGIEADYKALKVTTTLRYTRWTADTRRFFWTRLTEPNQLELLVSFTF